MSSRPRSVAIALLGIGLAGTVVACGAGGVAVWLAREGDGRRVDATPAAVSDPSRIRSGEVVWLRGRRDRAHPVTLRDGRVLFPTLEEPGVMVDCGDGTCEGTLVGSVEDLTIDGTLPAGWPDDAGRRVRIVVVGDVGDAARGAARVSGIVAAVALLVGVACSAVGGCLFVRGRER